MEKRIAEITKCLEDKKGEDIVVIDVSNCDYIVEKVVIVTAMAGKHAFALLDSLKTTLKPQGEHFYSTDEESEEWLIADLGDIMIHIFSQNHRKKFNLEEFLDKLKQDKLNQGNV